MPKLTALTVATAVAAAAIPSVVIAQGTTQTITAVDVQTLGTGLRSSKIVGSQVVNENRETIGHIDELIISKDIPDIVAIISVGGFLGVGSKLVAVKYAELQPTMDNKGFVLPGASKDSLKALPEFRYKG